MMPLLDESIRRKYIALESISLGRGGIAELHEFTGMAKSTIYAGLKEVAALEADPKAKKKADSSSRIRKEGGGRKTVEEKQPGLEKALLKLVDGSTAGSPENPLLWTTKSLRHISAQLESKGFKVGKDTVAKLLEQQGFSLQQNKKYVEAGKQSPDRDAQFKFINQLAKTMMEQNMPVISVDAKKKENIGNFKNGGAEYASKGQPIEVLDHDFMNKDNGKAVPYGIYDIFANEGFVSVGISADTAEFAVNSIRSWWEYMGKERYPDAKKILITADGGGSNGSRCRLWKKSLQDFANDSGLELHVCHFPPGTSKWNKIEHRMFAYISKNWRGRPPETLEVIINLIAATTTKSGLKIKCRSDLNNYAVGKKVTDEEMSNLNIERESWHGEWNYCISPQS